MGKDRGRLIMNLVQVKTQSTALVVYLVVMSCKLWLQLNVLSLN